MRLRCIPQTRKMRLSEFQAAYPGDFQAGALEEIRERCAAMAAAAAAAPVPATGRGGHTAAKRAAEPETVLRTVRARRAQVAPPPKFSEAAPPVPAEAGVTATRQGTRSRLASSAAAAQRQEQTEQHPGKWSVKYDKAAPAYPGCTVHVGACSPALATAGRCAGRGTDPPFPPPALPCCAEPAGSRRSAALPPAAAAAGGSLFQGMPLQTPMPFQGEAVPLPITMLTQKRGGRTKAAPAPDAMVIQTAGALPWRLVGRHAPGLLCGCGHASLCSSLQLSCDLPAPLSACFPQTPADLCRRAAVGAGRRGSRRHSGEPPPRGHRPADGAVQLLCSSAGQDRVRAGRQARRAAAVTQAGLRGFGLSGWNAAASLSCALFYWLLL